MNFRAGRVPRLDRARSLDFDHPEPAKPDRPERARRRVWLRR